MKKLIDLTTYPVKPVLDMLLMDKTTKKHIVFATSSYAHLGSRYEESSHIDPDLLVGLDAMELQPRVLKEAANQAARTRKRAEVMTPAWIVNKMNNHCDEEWFGYPEVFNKENGERWITNPEPIKFPEGKTWQQYVDSMRLEITCGEAPYLVSRYDTTTGETIPVKDRIGLLDRKLRVVGENTTTKEEWLKWATRAFQSVYGYEYQGDNLLIGRINLIVTFVDYMVNRWCVKPTESELKKIANIIAWNLWQMDGLKGEAPLATCEASFKQLSIWDSTELVGIDDAAKETAKCMIFDWRSRKPVIFERLRG